MKHKQIKQQEAKARQAKTDAMTPKQRLAALDTAFGKGQGAKKERAKLAAKVKGEDPDKLDVSMTDAERAAKEITRIKGALKAKRKVV